MDLTSLGYAFINTPGVGGVVILTVFITACTIYYFLARWIIAGGNQPDDNGPEQHEG